MAHYRLWPIDLKSGIPGLERGLADPKTGRVYAQVSNKEYAMELYDKGVEILEGNDEILIALEDLIFHHPQLSPDMKDRYLYLLDNQEAKLKHQAKYLA